MLTLFPFVEGNIGQIIMYASSNTHVYGTWDRLDVEN